jgi:hypothetical protein
VVGLARSSLQHQTVERNKDGLRLAMICPAKGGVRRIRTSLSLRLIA